jgi:hypothetical protein
MSTTEQFIYINSAQPLGEHRQDLEDDIESQFSGALLVTGGGTGSAGWNIDLEPLRLGDSADLIESLCEFLRGRPVPRDTWLNFNGSSIKVY